MEFLQQLMLYLYIMQYFRLFIVFVCGYMSSRFQIQSLTNWLLLILLELQYIHVDLVFQTDESKAVIKT